MDEGNRNEGDHRSTHRRLLEDTDHDGKRNPLLFVPAIQMAPGLRRHRVKVRSCAVPDGRHPGSLRRSVRTRTGGDGRVKASHLFAADRSAPMTARRELGRSLRGAVQGERLDDVLVATSELVTNATISGSDQRSGGALGRGRPGRGARGPARHGGAAHPRAPEPEGTRVRSDPLREHASARRPDGPVGRDPGTACPGVVRGRPHGRLDHEPVAPPSYGHDPLGADLPPEGTNVHVDDVRTGVEGETPHGLEELGPREELRPGTRRTRGGDRTHAG